MNLDTDEVVYFVSRNGFAMGTVKYGSGEFYAEVNGIEFETKSE